MKTNEPLGLSRAQLDEKANHQSHEEKKTSQRAYFGDELRKVIQLDLEGSVFSVPSQCYYVVLMT